MVEEGFTITRAIQSRSWPVSSASLEYAAVWGTRGGVDDGVPRVSDDIPVERISTLLEPAGGTEGSPVPLIQNSGVAFQGCNVLEWALSLSPMRHASGFGRTAGTLRSCFPT